MVELPRRNRGIKGTRPGTSAARPTCKLGVDEGSCSFCTPIASIGRCNWPFPAAVRPWVADSKRKTADA